MHLSTTSLCSLSSLSSSSRRRSKMTLCSFFSISRFKFLGMCALKRELGLGINQDQGLHTLNFSFLEEGDHSLFYPEIF